MADRFTHLFGGVEPREHHSLGSEIEHVADADSLRRFDAHQHGYVVRGPG